MLKRSKKAKQKFYNNAGGGGDDVTRYRMVLDLTTAYYLLMHPEYWIPKVQKMIQEVVEEWKTLYSRKEPGQRTSNSRKWLYDFRGSKFGSGLFRKTYLVFM